LLEKQKCYFEIFRTKKKVTVEPMLGKKNKKSIILNSQNILPYKKISKLTSFFEVPVSP
jgi:hypothetical protein